MRYSNTWMDAQISSVYDAANNIRAIEITPSTHYTFTPGAHIDVQVYINGEPATRSYSLVGTYAADKPYRISVKRLADSRGGSEYMWSLEAGAKLSISQPKNHFELIYGKESYLLMAGGIGITPIVGMAEELVRHNADFQLLYAGSSRGDMPFLDELSSLLGDKLKLHITDEQTRLDIPTAIQTMVAETQAYVCGPMRMLDEVRQIWQESGLPNTDLRYETFGTTGHFATQAFTVQIPRFAKSITVEKSQTLLDALNSNGIEVMSDCERGECGLCTVQILSCNGKVDHRDMFFSEEQKQENSKMCACVSRVVDGDIVIDTSYRGSKSLLIPNYE